MKKFLLLCLTFSWFSSSYANDPLTEPLRLVKGTVFSSPSSLLASPKERYSWEELREIQDEPASHKSKIFKVYFVRTLAKQYPGDFPTYVEYNKILQSMGIVIPAGKNAWSYSTLYNRLRAIVSGIRKELSEEAGTYNPFKNNYTKEYLTVLKEIKSKENKRVKTIKIEPIAQEDEQNIISFTPPRKKHKSLSAIDSLAVTSFPFSIEENKFSSHIPSFQEMPAPLTLANTINPSEPELFQISPVLQQEILKGFDKYLLYLLTNPSMQPTFSSLETL